MVYYAGTNPEAVTSSSDERNLDNRGLSDWIMMMRRTCIKFVKKEKVRGRESRTNVHW